MISLFNKTESSPDSIISSLYGLSSPDKELIEEREKRILEVKQKMGEKYILSIYINRKDNLAH